MITSLATQINYSDYREPKIVDQEKISQYDKLIIHIARQCDIARLFEIEDILQEGRIEMWKAHKHYDRTRGKFVSYLSIRLRGRFLNMRKAYFNNYIDAVSMDSNPGNGLPLKETIPARDNTYEDIYFEDLLETVLNNASLTQLERNVATLMIKHRESGRYHNVYSCIGNELKINNKSIDNAMRRAKQKIRCYVHLINLNPQSLV